MWLPLISFFFLALRICNNFLINFSCSEYDLNYLHVLMELFVFIFRHSSKVLRKIKLKKNKSRNFKKKKPLFGLEEFSIVFFSGELLSNNSFCYLCTRCLSFRFLYAFLPHFCMNIH